MFAAILFYVIAGAVWGFATQTVISNKGHDENWFWWGFFFGIIALLVAVGKPENIEYCSESYIERQNEEILKKGGWSCSRCGKLNAGYVGTCVCGNTRYDENRILEIKREEEKIKEKEKQEIENIQKIKHYKELLDCGIISQEQFDKKKEELLNL